jgi:hypothetical protein
LAAEDHPLRHNWLRVRSHTPRLNWVDGGFAYRRMLRPCPWTTIATVGLPSCVTPSLDYYRFGSHAPPHRRGPKATVDKVSGGEHHRTRQGRHVAGTGISTRCPSTTPVGLALGPDLPRADELDPGTLDHSAPMFLTSDSLLMPAFSLAPPPPLDHSGTSPAARRSPTHPHT